MTGIPDAVFIAAGVLAVVGGSVVAYRTLTARTRRMPEERGVRPQFERFCGAIIDHAMVVAPNFCRISLYDEFLVVRAPAVALRLKYEQVVSATVGRAGGAEAVLLTLADARCSHVALFLGVENAILVERIAARRPDRVP